MVIREGHLGDVPAVLAMFDSAVAWLTARGRTGQWGSEPFSADPARVERVTLWAASGGMRIAEVDGRPAGSVVVGPPVVYVAPAPEPELYVQSLVVDRRFPGRGVGAALLTRARTEAAERGVGLLRVDCYAGDDGRLVRYYESQGFTRAETFHVGDWPGQVLQMRLPSVPVDLNQA
ncbi:GNAT superfamily N-acetyltransferase [Streptosporangium becharense]|uniref:GNAT superfamily N-acetyltransferase n=1 Tax=Streptosporangium becharense TaxID=1816182 RepID=A0A7W9IGW3_9ACTN|nr:GNAT family N-acetyltransferase [Streptosporangium becharense]MBB2912626.1 GNAT superfamily N-acetyltransferase [Streptosporangium becharense]MBB5820545.1 GNAT superfamily N-acetyltransferase [Streptosporangium becharense]